LIVWVEYIGADNAKHEPVMIHHLPPFQLIDFVAVLIEHCGGVSFVVVSLTELLSCRFQKIC
jgi:threonyl-tRNA synthetase